MTDCKHGLEETWCSLCRGDVEVQYRDIKHTECCAPGCSRASTKRLGALPLCNRHMLSVERRVVRVYKPPRPTYRELAQYEKEKEPGWVYFVQIDTAIKIGHSKQPDRRLKSFGVYSLDTTVHLLSLERGDRAKENRLHRKFSDHQFVIAGKSNELFRPVESLFGYIRTARQCSAFTVADIQCKSRAKPDSLTCGGHVDDPSIPESVYRLYADRQLPHEDVA